MSGLREEDISLDGLEIHSSDSLVDVAEGKICVSEYLRLLKRLI